MDRNTKGEQWTAKPQAHRKQNIRALCLEAQELTPLALSWNRIQSLSDSTVQEVIGLRFYIQIYLPGNASL